MITTENPATFVWIAGTVLTSWLVPRNWTPVGLVGICAFYLGWYAPWSLAILLSVTLITGAASVYVKHRRNVLVVAIILCFTILLAYRLFASSTEFSQEALLLGFAFYILRAIHLLIECYAGRIERPQWNEIIPWLWFLPTLQVGPIHRFESFRRDLRRRRWDAKLFAEGLERLLFGYLKIVVFANYLVNRKLSLWIDTLTHDGWCYHYLDSLQYGLNLYFKFAGYSDVAIGFSLLLGFRVMENFNFPFLATNIIDFWRRWHISLSSWCRDYIYVPIFSLTRLSAVAALTTMLFIGLWHEFSWRYLIWGIWHGAGIAICQQWQRTAMAAWFSSSAIVRLWTPFSMFITLNFVILSFSITGTDSLVECLERLKILFGISL